MRFHGLHQPLQMSTLNGLHQLLCFWFIIIQKFIVVSAEWARGSPLFKEYWRMPKNWDGQQDDTWICQTAQQSCYCCSCHEMFWIHFNFHPLCTHHTWFKLCRESEWVGKTHFNIFILLLVTCNMSRAKLQKLGFIYQVFGWSCGSVILFCAVMGFYRYENYRVEIWNLRMVLSCLCPYGWPCWIMGRHVLEFCGGVPESWHGSVWLSWECLVCLDRTD